MTSRDAAAAIRRLLVALDASPQSVAALDAAAALASRLGAEIEGLFIEDEDFVRLGGMGLARVFDPASPQGRAPESEEIERALRSAARRARADLEDRARRAQVRAHFRVVRGRVAAELLAAAAGADVVCLGAASWPGAAGRRLGRTTRSVVSGAPAAVLVVRTGSRAPDVPVVLHDGSPGARRALAMAGALALRGAGRIVVFVPPGTGGGRAAARDDAAEVLEPDVRCDVSDVVGADARTIARAFVAARGGTLVLPESALDVAELESLLGAAAFPVLVVR